MSDPRGMAMRKTSARAPGSLMLLGEHAVLQGQPACVCAINRFIEVELVPRDDDVIHLSSALGTHQTTLSALAPDTAFRFVLEVIRRAVPLTGFSLAITSEMSPVMGLGTSAAVTVAAMAALDAAMGKEPDVFQLAQRSRDVIRAVQGGVGSGADVFASAYGGLLLFHPGGAPEKHPRLPPLTLLYSGIKVPTPEVIAIVAENRRRAPDDFATLDILSGQLADTAFHAAANENWPVFADCMTQNQDILARYGVNTPRLQELVDALRTDPGIYAAKISGSGLGDCVVGLGHAKQTEWDAPALFLEASPSGATTAAD